MRLHKFLLIFLFIFLFAFYLFRSAVTLDPDFGWHIQFGRLITSTRSIPVTDPYSYSMPSYHFIDHEWGMDILTAVIFDQFGMWPLNISFALLGVCTLLFLLKGAEQRLVTTPLFLAGGTMFDFMGVRPQIISWFFLALLMSVLWQKKDWQKWRFFVPGIFLVWANLHGGFAVGIVVLGLFVLGQAIEEKQINRGNSFVFVISLLITLCNPYGYHLWTEIIKSATDPALRFTIQEWYPAIFFDNLAFWIYTAISCFLLIRYWRKFSITTLLLYSVLLVAGFSSERNIPLYIIVSFYPTIKSIKYLYQEAGKHAYGKERFMIGYRGFSLVCLCLFLPQLGAFVFGYIMYPPLDNGYPAGAVSYLSQHLPRGQIFSSYGWGGYLIWQLPEKKVFIDGRMPSWRNPSAPKDESTYAFGEYKRILQRNISFAIVSRKYGIDTVLVSTGELHEEPPRILGIDISKTEILKPIVSSVMSFAPVVTEIKQMGWKVVYQDGTAVVFEKPGPNIIEKNS